MLHGVNLLNFDIGEIEEGDFFIHFKDRNREDDFKFNLIPVYSPAQVEHKSIFFSEMVHVCSKDTLPFLCLMR